MKRHCFLLFAVGLSVALSASAQSPSGNVQQKTSQQKVLIDARQTGKTFDGIGVVNGGGPPCC